MKSGYCLLGALVLCGCFLAQNRPADSRPQLDLSQETTGLDRISKTLVSAFDRVDIVALTDTHQKKIDSDLRLALVRSPEFSKKVRLIIIEFANTVDQPILDRYLNGEDVSLNELRQVWRNTCCPGTWESPVYAEFFRTVRELNLKAHADRRIRVLGGDPPAGTPATERMASAIAVMKKESLDKSGKALIIYGGHVNYDGEITRMLQQWRPGRTLVIQALGGTDAEYQQFDRALKSHLRPILVSGMKAPFNNFDSAFLISNKIVVNGVAVSVPPASPGTLSQLADAFVYFGSTGDADTFIRPARQ